MIGLDVLSKLESVLVLGAHCDDIEIGCGGLLQRLARVNPGVRVHWVTFSSDPVRALETRTAARALIGDCAVDMRLLEFRNGYFPFVGASIKDYFEALKVDVAPDLVLTHFGGDLHQDHRVVSELTWNTFRSHWILEYEIPKYDGGLGSPAVFLPLSRDDVDHKIETLLAAFASQREKQWFCDETFRGLMRLRGIECDAPEGYAEAFYVRKIVVC